MKVVRNTPDQLILENNPWLLAILVCAFALIFVTIGLFTISSDLWLGVSFLFGGLLGGTVFVAAFVRRTQLILDRPRNLVERRRRSVLGYSKMTWKLEHLAGAAVQSSQSGDSTTYRAALRFNGGMDAGTHPITLVYSSGSGADRAARAINAWLDTEPDAA